jgi:allantoinase
MKETSDFFKVWGGIAGAQSFLPALSSAGLDTETIGQLAASNVASRFGLSARKGAIAIGMDADLVLVDPRGARTLRREDLLMRHAVSPYLGREFPASIESVWLRGTPVWSRTGGRGPARGRLVRPTI